MNRTKSAIPNLITLANLACGVVGIILLFEGEINQASYLIWLAAAFDFLDGFLAKLFKAQSEIGKQLDSLADLVTFGVLPSLIYFKLLQNQFEWPLEYFSILVALFSAYRLAKFNIDDSQKTTFSGLPTPANAILISSIPLILSDSNFLTSVFTDPTVLLTIMLITSILMVSPITLLSLKFNDFSIRKNIDKWLLMAGSVALLVTFRVSAIPMIMAFYILLSAIIGLRKKGGL